MSPQRQSKVARRRVDPLTSSSEISSVNEEFGLDTGMEQLGSFDDSDYDFEQLLDENVSLGEFDQLSDRLLTGFELQAKISSLSSSSISSCSTPRTDSPSLSTSRGRKSTSKSLSVRDRSNTTTDDTYSQSGGEIISQPKKRKRKSYYIKRFPFPRILKRDIRRDYAIMLTNVLNSADESLMLKFFHRFCMSSCQYVDCFPDEYINNKPFIRYAKGVDAIVYRLLQDFSSIPDFVIRLQHASIVQRKDLIGSKIVCQVEFSGTKMFHYMRPELITSIEELSLSDAVEQVEESKEPEKEQHSSRKEITMSMTNNNNNNSLLQNVMKQVHELMNYSSPSTLSDTIQTLQSNRMKILSLYSDEQQQLLNNLPIDILTEMKLGSDCVDQLTPSTSSPLPSVPFAESFLSSSRPSIPTTAASLRQSNLEEKWDSQQMEQLMQQFTSSSSSSPSTSSQMINFPKIPSIDNISHPQLLKKCDKPLLSKPLSIKFMGEITLSLNEEHWLSQLEVKSSIYDTKVLLGAMTSPNSNY